MVAFSQKKTASLTLLSIMLPISLLAGSRIAGIIPEPKNVTITIEPVVWSYERPLLDISQWEFVRLIESWVKNAYDIDGVIIEFGILVYEYRELYDFGIYGERDCVDIRVSVNASVSQGSISNILVSYRPKDPDAMLLVSYPVRVVKNATVTDMNDTGTNTSEAYVQAVASSSSCSLTVRNYWVFTEEDAVDHGLQTTLEVTCLDRTGIRKVVLPIFLEMPVQT